MLDVETLEEMYPPERHVSRSIKDKEDLFDKMVRELSDFYSEETRKAYMKNKADSDEPFHSFVQVNLDT